MKKIIPKTKKHIEFESTLRKALIERKLRDGLSNRKLAKEFGVSASRLGGLISGNVDPKLNELIRMLTFFNFKLVAK